MTDPSISLQVHTPTPADPMDQYAKAQAIRGQMQQRQLGAIQIEQQKLALDAQKTSNEAWRVGLGMNPDGSKPDSGPSPSAATPTPQAPSAVTPAQAPPSPADASPQSAGAPPDDTTPGEAPPPSAMALSRPAMEPIPNAQAGDGAAQPIPNAQPGSAQMTPIPNAQAPSDAATPPQAAPPSAMALTRGSAPPAANAAPPTMAQKLAAPAQPAAPPQSRPAPVPPGANAPHVDYDKIAQYMAQHGHGSLIMPMRQAQVEYQQKLAQQQKTTIEAHQLEVAQVAQALQQVEKAPDDQKAQAYRLALQTALPLAQKLGLPDHFPPQYDPATTPAFISQKLAEATEHVAFSREAREAADLQYRMATGLPKTVEDLTKQYQQDISTAKNQDDFDAINRKWDAMTATVPAVAKLFKPIKTDEWTPDVAQDAAMASMPPKDRPKYWQEQLSNAANMLHGANTYGDLQKAVQNLGSPALKAQFSRFATQDPNAPVSETDLQWIDQQGETPDQRLRRKELEDSLAERHAHNQDTTALMQQLRDIQQQNADNRANHETAGEKKSRISALADRAIEESTDNGGQGPADALKNVQNPKFYTGDEIGDSRGEVAKELQSRMPKPNAKADQPTALERMQWMRDHPDQPVPTTRTAMQATKAKTAAPPKAAQAAQPAATPTPTSAKPAANTGNANSFSLHIPPELATKFGGKSVLVFKSQKDANAFAAEAGLTVH